MISKPEPEDLGAFGNAFGGYGRAWRHWRELLPVLAPILVPSLLIRFAVRALESGDDTAIVNGVVSLPVPEGAWAWLDLALTGIGWGWAIGAAILVAAGAMRGIAVSPGRAVLRALYLMPELGIFLVAIGAIVPLSVLVGGLFLPLVAVAALVFGALAAARLLVTIPRILLRGNTCGAWIHASGRWLSVVGATVVGVIGLPLGLLWLTGKLSELVAGGAIPGELAPLALTLVTQTVHAVVALAVVAGQAGTLAQVYLMRRAADDPGRVPDLSVVDGKLATLTGRPVRGTRLVAASSLVLPAVLVAVVTLANPLAAPSVSTHSAGFPGVVAVGWPEGGHPVIVTSGGIRFCHDDECRGYTSRRSPVGVMTGHGVAAVGADGSVVEATLTGSQEIGGPFVHLARCTVDKCEDSWVPTRASSDEEFIYPEVAVGAAPDGTVFIALVVPLPGDRRRMSNVELKLIRCADVACARPQRHSFGVVEGTAEPTYYGPRTFPVAHIAFDNTANPVISYRVGSRVWKAACTLSTCDGKRMVGHQAHSSAYPLVPLPGVDTGVLTLGGAQLWHCRADTCTDTVLEGCCVNEDLSALALAGSGSLAVSVIPAGPPEGIHIRIGAPSPQRQRLVLVHCPDLECRDPARIPLTVTETELNGLWIAERDGRVLIVASNWQSSTLISTTLPSPATHTTT